MPFYSPIKRWRDDTERTRTADRLLALRRKLHAEITDTTGRDSLRLATWNIRDFDSNKFGHGPRLRESFYYIAEIIAAFDLVAIQEVSRDLTALERLMRILGPQWDYIATDTTEGRGGNEERMAFVFRRSKVQFRRIAGEVVLPAGQTIVAPGATGDDAEHLQFARTPFLVAFQAGWYKFNLCTVHIYYGADTGPRLQRRVKEIEAIGRFFRRRQERQGEDYILLGDFNIRAPGDITMDALEKESFRVPDALRKHRTNLKGDKYYDQIALRVKDDRLEVGGGGVLRFDDVVFRDTDEDFAAYGVLMPEEKASDLWNGGPRGYYADQWRTWQMSDHVPLWVELKVDFSDHYLDRIRLGGGGE